MRPFYPHFFTLLSPALFAGLTLFAPGLSAQEGDDEPDPFIVIGEKPGDPAADAANAEPKKAAMPPVVKPPEPLSAQISQHIQKLAEAEREKRLTFMKVVIDDIVRLCQLDDEQEEKLLLAAKGASERSMKEWHEQAER